jgi:hypothetical protein
MFPSLQIHQRDDGFYDVVSGDDVAGPFPTINFAMTVASGVRPEPKPATKFHRFKAVREMLNAGAA